MHSKDQHLPSRSTRARELMSCVSLTSHVHQLTSLDYINDGVYGSFNCIMFDHQIVHPYPLTIGSELTTARPSFPPPPNVALPVDLPVQLGYTDNEKASVWGPTCDSIDCVRQVVKLPKGLEVGDWLAWGEMGAYTLCAASTFNG